MFRALGNALLITNVLSSVVMAIYSFRILWGDINLGFMVFPQINPDKLTFSMAIYDIALPGALYALSQVIGPLFRWPGSVWLYMGAVLTSIASAAVVGYADLKWMGGGYAPTIYQAAAMQLWTISILIDLAVIGVGARFLQRSWLGEGGVGHGH